MHYSIDSRIFHGSIGSPCYAMVSDFLSETDKQGMARAYPAGSAEVRKQLLSDRASIQAAAKCKDLDSRDAAVLKSKLRAIDADMAKWK